MRNLTKIWFITVGVICFFNISAIDAYAQNSGLYFEEIYDLFVEPLLDTPYVFITPKGALSLVRTVNSKGSIIETCLENNIESRYKMTTGFVFQRNETRSNRWRDELDTTKEVEDFFYSEITKHKVFFYDQKYLSVDRDCAICEGKIFSPDLGATGLFFLKRQNPAYNGKDSSTQGFYLLYYSFEFDYEFAKLEFEKIAGYIHFVKNGLVE